MQKSADCVSLLPHEFTPSNRAKTQSTAVKATRLPFSALFACEYPLERELPTRSKRLPQIERHIATAPGHTAIW